MILPIALPGIVTGMALNSTFTQVARPLDLYPLFTVIVGHATFCIVVVYNNVVARLRRTSRNRSRRRRADLGAHTWQTIRARDAPPATQRDGRGRAAGFRAELRRGDRDHVHRRQHRDAADLDPQQPLAAANPLPIVNVVARGQRAALDHSRVLRPEALRRPGRPGGTAAAAP